MTESSAILIVTGLITLAVLLIWPVQQAMVRRQVFRREPLLSLLVWQAVSLAAVLSLLAAGPVAVLLTRGVVDESRHRVITGIALAVTIGLLVRLAVAGHRVGTSLRRTRRQHRDLLELVGHAFAELDRPTPRSVRVIEHATPTAYCIPGMRTRVVISTGMLARLSPLEVDAVLAHERSHVRGRHDLLVEFFTVLHTAMPARLRQDAVLAEVHLLAEVVADRAAARTVGPVPMGRALVALANSAHPAATLGAVPATHTTQVRLSLLGLADRRSWAMVAIMLGYALLAVTAPMTVVLVSSAVFGMIR